MGTFANYNSGSTRDFERNNFAIAQFQEIDGWKVAEMTGIQEGIGGEGVVTVLKLKMLEKHESLEETEESNIESSGTQAHAHQGYCRANPCPIL